MSTERYTSRKRREQKAALARQSFLRRVRKDGAIIIDENGVNIRSKSQKVNSMLYSILTLNSIEFGLDIIYCEEPSSGESLIIFENENNAICILSDKPNDYEAYIQFTSDMMGILSYLYGSLMYE